MSGRWRDFLRGLRGAADTNAAGALPPKGSTAAPVPASSVPSQASDIELLSTEIRRIGILDARPTQADPSWMAALQRLWQSGAQDAALRFGTALAAAIPSDDALSLQVAAWLLHQGNLDAAHALLDRILDATRSGHGQVPMPAAATAIEQQARLLRSEVRGRKNDAAGSRADLADLLIVEWPSSPASPSSTALSRYRKGKRARLAHDGALPDASRLMPASFATADLPTLVGEVAPSRYRLLYELGAGGNGVVYAALDTQLGCELALKLFDVRVDGHHVLHEAKLLSALQHPGVLSLYTPDLEGRFITMELCRGGSLRARLRREALPLAAVLQRTRELCDALAAVHAVAIVHGDIKPENLLFRDVASSLRSFDCDPGYGDLVIGDFGIAERIATADQMAPQTLRGTRAYLAPERLHGAPGSAAADLYSVGVVLFEMLSGTVPLVPMGQVPPAEDIEQATSVQPGATSLQPLLAALLSLDPGQRPPAALVCQIVDRLLTAATVL